MDDTSVIGSALGTLRALLTDRAVSNVLRERLMFAVERLELAQQVVGERSRRIAELEQQLEQAQQQLAARRAKPEFFEHGGTLWKRRGDGRITRSLDDVPYCHGCHLPMAAIPAGEHFHCRPCRRHTSFTERQLPRALAAALAALAAEDA